MKINLPTTVLALTMLGAFSAGSVSAAIPSEKLRLSSIPGVTSTNLGFRLDNGVATLFGRVESGIESALVMRHVSKLEGVDKVVNRIIVD